MVVNIEINAKAYKDLKKIHTKDVVNILEEMKDLANFPDSKNIKRLTNFQPSYRKRVGEYRILFEVESSTLIIYRIFHRKDAYK